MPCYDTQEYVGHTGAKLELYLTMAAQIMKCDRYLKFTIGLLTS